MVSEAKKARIAALEKLLEGCPDKDGPCIECVEQRLYEAAYDAFEEAAKVAEGFKPLGGGELKLRKGIAAAIRALKEKVGRVPLEDAESLWHFKRTCAACGFVWGGLHCVHDGYQNPCPGCGAVPETVPEPEAGCRCEFDV